MVCCVLRIGFKCHKTGGNIQKIKFFVRRGWDKHVYTVFGEAMDLFLILKNMYFSSYQLDSCCAVAVRRNLATATDLVRRVALYNYNINLLLLEYNSNMVSYMFGIGFKYHKSGGTI